MKARFHRAPDPPVGPAVGRSRTAARALIALLAAWTLAGCSSVRTYKGFPLGGEGVYLGGVPALRQDARYACGATCLAAVAVYWGVSLDACRDKCSRLPQESSGAELQALAGDLGLQAFAFHGSEADLRANLQRGRPLIVMLPKPIDPLLPPGGPLGNVLRAAGAKLPHPPHWVIVLGYTAAGDIILHDPDSGPLQMGKKAFSRDWAKMGHECVLVVARSGLAPGNASATTR
jgi:ABC-type bacteriocin/lantibiotic exporter with double-glycine peptidase domain